MNMQELLKGNRSYRRFGKRKVTEGELRELIGAAGLCASAANLQQLRFMPVCGDGCERVFPHLRWAGYLPEWDGPEAGERPGGYLVVLCPVGASAKALVGIDIGIAAQSVLLTAREMGLGGCMFAGFDRAALTATLGVDDTAWEIALVIALGEPCEQVRIVGVSDGNIKYYRDEKGVHYVPKRTVDELTVLPQYEA